MDQEKKKIRRLTGAESNMEHEPAPDTPEVAPPAGEKHDPFDPQFLKKAYTQQQELNVKRKILRLPVHRPERHSFFRTHPDLEWWLEVGLLEFEREQYLVDPELFEFLEPCGASRRLLIPTITRQSAVLLWPIRLPGPYGRIDTWSQTALDHPNLMGACPPHAPLRLCADNFTMMPSLFIGKRPGHLQVPGGEDRT